LQSERKPTASVFEEMLSNPTNVSKKRHLLYAPLSLDKVDKSLCKLRKKILLMLVTEKRGTSGIEELEEFLRSRGRTLLIKGEPGMGKTTLSMQLQQHLGGKRGVYISSRVSEEAVHQYLPWSVEAVTQESFMDTRLSTVQSFLEKVFQVVREKAPIVVLDTWDAFAKKMDGKERLKTEEVLIALAANSDSRIIFVSEEPSQTTLDYLVDGIIELRACECEGRLCRELVTHKLRGVPIIQHRRVFSLYQAKARAFPPYRDSMQFVQQRFRPIQDHDGSYSFGSETLDALLGGLKKGSTLTIEYSHDVPYGALRLLTWPMAANFLLKNRGVLALPLPGTDYKIYDLIGEWSKAKKLKPGLLKLLVPTEENNASNSLVHVPFEKMKRARRASLEIANELKKRSKDGVVLGIRSVSFLETRYASQLNELVEILSDIVTQNQSSGDAAIFYLESESPIRFKVLAISQIHIRLTVKNGSVIMFGVKPYTGAYVLEPDPEAPQPRFTPIV
jgi:KaiC/GvpD/RAD55 family RecA-like ATPase